PAGFEGGVEGFVDEFGGFDLAEVVEDEDVGVVEVGAWGAVGGEGCADLGEEGGDAVEGDGVTGFGEVVAGGDGEVGFAVAGGAPEVEVLAGLEGFGGVDGGGVAGV